MNSGLVSREKSKKDRNKNLWVHSSTLPQERSRIIVLIIFSRSSTPSLLLLLWNLLVRCFLVYCQTFLRTEIAQHEEPLACALFPSKHPCYDVTSPELLGAQMQCLVYRTQRKREALGESKDEGERADSSSSPVSNLTSASEPRMVTCVGFEALTSLACFMELCPSYCPLNCHHGLQTLSTLFVSLLVL